jgi:hypothetical protein
MPDLLRFKAARLEAGVGQSLAVTVNGGSLPVSMTGASNILTGAGTLVGEFTLTNGAAIAPGSSPGRLNIDGDAVIGAGGVLSVELAGPRVAADYDQLNVLGDVVLDGALLDLKFLNGFVPSRDEGFVILRARSLIGKFTNATDTINVGASVLPVTYRNNMVIVGNASAVPEPSCLSLVVTIVGVSRLRRVCRQKL